MGGKTSYTVPMRHVNSSLDAGTLVTLVLSLGGSKRLRPPRFSGKNLGRDALYQEKNCGSLEACFSLEFQKDRFTESSNAVHGTGDVWRRFHDN